MQAVGKMQLAQARQSVEPVQDDVVEDWETLAEMLQDSEDSCAIHRDIRDGQDSTGRSAEASQISSILEAVIPRAQNTVGSNAQSAPVYQGVVKYFRGSFGWVTCAKLANRDVFLHKKECDTAPKQWDDVQFELVFDDAGNPKATKAVVVRAIVEKVKPEPAKIPACDWFAKRKHEKRRL